MGARRFERPQCAAIIYVWRKAGWRAAIENGKFICCHDIAKTANFCYDELEILCRNIREKLVAGVEKRLIADVKAG